MLLYGHAAELAIRAALFLSLQPPGKRSTVQEVAQGTRLPQPYLAKILRQLAIAHLVRAFRGPGGGMELGRPAEAITLGAIVEAVEGAGQSGRCALGAKQCSEEAPCPLHEQWRPLCEEMQRLLEETTLAALRSQLGSTLGPRVRPPHAAGDGHASGRAKGKRNKRSLV
jgi:Rrf2 family protein